MPDPPPCASSDTGSITSATISASGITKSGWTLLGSLSGSVSGTSPCCCAPHATKFVFAIDYDLYIYKRIYVTRDSEPILQVVEYPDTINLGTINAQSGIGNSQGYISNASVSVSTNFETIFNTHYTSDPYPPNPQDSYITYELHSLGFVCYYHYQIGHANPFIEDRNATANAGTDYLPV